MKLKSHPTWVALALLLILRVSAPTSAAADVLDFVDSLEGPPYLGFPLAVAFSPDGRHLYVGSAEDRALLVFDVSGPTLELVATVAEGADGPGTLRFPSVIVISADGRHVYVSYRSDDAVAVFARDPATGELRFIEAHSDGVDGVEGIRDPREMVLSPDGRHLYVSGLASSAVAVFARDAATGELTFLEALFDTDELRLKGAYSMAFSPDGRYLYVVGNRNFAVTLFERDAATGALAAPDLVFDGFRPYDVAVSPDGRHLYITSSYGALAYEIDASTGKPASYVGRFGLDIAEDDGLDSYLEVSPDGRYVYTISFNGFRAPFRVYERDAETGIPTLIETLSDRGEGLSELGFPQDFAVSPDGSRVAVVSVFIDALALLERDPGSEAWRFADVWIDGSEGVDGLLGASAVAVSPDGNQVYATSQWDDALVVLARDPRSGRLSFVEAHFDGVAGVEGLDYARAVAISPDGRHLYVTGYRGAGAVAVFERQAGTGKLSFIGADGPPRFGSGWLMVSPDGAHVYARGALFSRDATSGSLTFVAELPDLGPTLSAVVSQDGRYVYAADDALVWIFERDPATGALTRLESPPPFDQECYFMDGIGVETYCGPRSLALSPDGRQLYVGLLGFLGGGVMAFERDLDTGLLNHFATYVEGEGYFFSALPPDLYSIVMAPDGRYVYLTSWFAGSVVVLSRDRASGALAFSEIHIDDRDGADGFSGPEAAAVSPDGRHLYVASPEEDAVVVFERNCVSGEDALCLNGDRFQVDVEWRDFEGKTGSARVVPMDSADSGLLWFFAADNWEMLVKVLDGCGLNEHFWVFAAATTNVEYTLTVTDMETGVAKSYFNPLGNSAAAITDTGALAACTAEDGQRAPITTADLPPAPEPAAASKQGTCTPGPSAMCLDGARFQLEVEWRDFRGQTGSGRVVPSDSDDSGLFWFFAAANWEMLVKVLDGCAINDRFWVFAAATTNVEYTLRVTDTETGVVREYHNPLGIAADAVTDTGAFATCP